MLDSCVFFFLNETCTSKFKSQERYYQSEQPSEHVLVNFLPREGCRERRKRWGAVGRGWEARPLRCWWQTVVRGRLPRHTGSAEALERILSSCGRRFYTDNTFKPESSYNSTCGRERGMCTGAAREEPKYFKAARAAHCAFHRLQSCRSSQKRCFKDRPTPLGHFENPEECQWKLKTKSAKQNRTPILWFSCYWCLAMQTVVADDKTVIA